MTEARIDHKKRPLPKRIAELEDLKVWLEGLDSRPKLHVNGPNFATAILTVDFGSPLEEQKITSEASGELVNRMRSVTRLLCKQEANVRVQTDNANGVWWSSIG